MKRLGVDIGGTFTDLLLYDDERDEIVRAKVPSTPGTPEQGVLEGLAALGVSAAEIDMFVHGTTIVTNLVIERQGATVGILTTKGFEDLLEMQLTYRADPYDLQWQKAPALVPRSLRMGISERLGADGSVIRPLDEAEVAMATETLLDRGAEAIAVCFLHSYRNAEHEARAKRVVRALAPTVPVSISSEVDPQVREYQRLSTTVLNSYAMPRISGYIGELQRTARPKGDVLYMHSGGGVLPSALAREFPVFLVHSGPAGGALGAGFAAGSMGLDDIIGMDMGGTSCDISIIRAGEPDRSDAVWVDWMIPARLQAIEVSTIGAGGGSVAWVDSGGRLRIGPRSSGADPGPACYGRGGTEPTTTDANLVLGIINPTTLLAGDFPLEADRAWKALDELGEELDLSAEEVARGIYRVVNANMAQAVREMTVERGIDPRDFTLVAFGGAGGQHAAAVAEEIGIRRVLFPKYASVLSAFGMTTADIRYPVSRSYLQPLDASGESGLREAYLALEERAAEGIQSDAHHDDGTEVTVQWAADMRYVGQMFELRVHVDRDEATAARMGLAFQAEHQAQYGTTLDDPIELINLHAIATRSTPKPSLPQMAASTDGFSASAMDGTPRRRVFFEPDPVAVVMREQLDRDSRLTSPLLIEDLDSTVFVPYGWHIEVDPRGHVIIERR